MFRSIFSFVLTITCCLDVSAGFTCQQGSQVRPVNIELMDFRGENFEWKRVGSTPQVVLFLSTGCPLAKLYAGKLEDIYQEFKSQGLSFLIVDCHAQDSLEEMAAFARLHKLEVDFVKDVGQHLAREFDVARTPEVILLSTDGEVAYRGRIDDQYGVGYTKKASEKQELRDALTAVLAAKPVPVPRTTPPGCLVTYANKTHSTKGKVTYAGQVAAILNGHCVRCHRNGQIGPFPLDNYEDAAGWSEMIAEVVREQRMPPWHADPRFGDWSNDCSLSSTDKTTILEWVQAGAPSGDLSVAPGAAEFVPGWQLPREPDSIISVTEQAVKIRARGDLKYQYFVCDPGFKEDKWVMAAELRPSNLRVVHHILCFVRPKGADGLGGDGEGLDGFLVGYVPGMLPQPLPAGMAKRIPKGSELVFQMHYTPIGSAQEDLSQLGLVFMDAADVTHEVVTTCAVNPRIKIPAGAGDHVEQAWDRHPLSDWRIVSLMPHMHLRGKAFKYEAVYPDGKRQTLLEIPKYDFNWQTSYFANKPLELPKGTKIFCTAKYDNSDKNLNNPDATQEVRWGDQTWEEMMIGYFDVAIPISDQAARDEMAQRARPKRPREEIAADLMRRWDKNKDQLLQLEEVPERWRKRVERMFEDKPAIDLRELANLLDETR